MDIMFLFFFRTENNKKDRLFNDTVRLFKTNKWGFTNQTAETTGKFVIEAITNTMWYPDPFWERLNSRSVSVPDCLRPLTGYRELRKQKKASKGKVVAISKPEIQIHYLSKFI